MVPYACIFNIHAYGTMIHKYKLCIYTYKSFTNTQIITQNKQIQLTPCKYNDQKKLPVS